MSQVKRNGLEKKKTPRWAPLYLTNDNGFLDLAE
jgi:hypothetical protein